MTLQAEAFHKLHPKEFHKKFLEQKVRPDGRGLTKVRKPIIVRGSLAQADGSALVRMGNTTVICGLRLEVGVPQAVKPKHGRLEIGMHLTPLCSPKFSVGRATEHAIAMAENLATTITATGVVELSELCIRSGSSVWVVYADCLCLDYDGNAFDCALLALVAALRDLRIPETEVDEQGVVYMGSQRSQRLTIAHTPVACTFGMIDDFVLADPTAEEEDLLNASWTIIYNGSGQLCSVLKPGGTAISGARLRQCMALAKAHALTQAPLLSAAAAASAAGTASVAAAASSSSASSTSSTNKNNNIKTTG